MVRVQRGAVGASSLHGNKADANRPQIRIPTVKAKDVPAGKTVGYLTNVARCLHVRIVAHPTIPGMAELTRVVQSHHPEGAIKFDDWKFETTNPSVARWIDVMVQQGILKGVYRDTHAIKVRCEFCDKTFLNTPKGLEDMAFHIMADHDTPEDGLDITDLSAFFGNLDAIGEQIGAFDDPDAEDAEDDDDELEDGEGAQSA